MLIWLGIKEILHMLLNIGAELVHLTAGISLSNEYKINFVLWMAVVQYRNNGKVILPFTVYRFICRVY